MKWTSKKALLPVGIIALGLIIFLILILSKSGSDHFATQAPIKPVQIQTLKQQTHSPQVILYGKVQSPRHAKLEASIDAFVEATPALVGTRVKKGQLLIDLSKDVANNTYQQRHAEVQGLDAEIKAEKNKYKFNIASLAHERHVLKLLENDLNRFKKLELRKYISASDLDKAVRDVKRQNLLVTRRELSLDNYKHRINQLKAKLNRAKALRERAQIDINRTLIKAPFAGQITKLNVSVGDHVQPGEVLVEMFDNTSLEVKAQIPDRWLSVISIAHQKKQPITARLKYHDQIFNLTLTRLSGMISQGKGAVECIFELPHDAYLPMGISVPIAVNLPPIKNVFAVPEEAIYNNERAYKVVNQKLVAVDINKLGNLYLASGKRMTIIKSKQLKNGDQLMITHLPNAITGLKVRPVDEKRNH